MIVKGKKYKGFKVTDEMWMVKRFQSPTSQDDESGYVECQIVIKTDDEETAIKAAIAQGSWA